MSTTAAKDSQSFEVEGFDLSLAEIVGTLLSFSVLRADTKARKKAELIALKLAKRVSSKVKRTWVTVIAAEVRLAATNTDLDVAINMNFLHKLKVFDRLAFRQFLSAVVGHNFLDTFRPTDLQV